MSTSAAELSSLAAQLTDLIGRVARAAESLSGDGAAEAAADLFEVERALATAARRLEAARRTLD